MKEKLFNNETKRKAGQQGREESQHPVYQRQPKQLGLYDAENEHDACGVGMLVNIHGGKSHELVESALKVLENMRHRGAEGADNKTGDGAGILLQIPHEFILLQGIPVPEKGKYGTGLLFLPKDEKDQGAILSIIIEEIEKEALEAYVPIIRKETQSFLKVLLTIQKPKRILEVGTAVGFSAVLMSHYMPKDGHIITIENYEKRIPIAKPNFVRAGKEKQITLLEGDAADILKELREPFDFIFMDAAKGQYIHFMPEIFRLLKPEGILVSDNVLQDGDIIESHFIVTRRNRTIYKRMREYLYELTHSDELVTSVLPIGDGITVSVKK